MQYKVVYSQRQAAFASVSILVTVYQSPDGVTWTQIPDAQRWLSLPSAAVLQVVQDNALNAQQKRDALNAMLLAQVEDWGVVSGQEARAALEELVPQWPVTVNL